MLDVSALANALAQLETSLRYLHSDASKADPELRKQFRAAAIKGFEFTYELAVKMIRRQLAEILPSPDELRQLPFMDMMRTAADSGLIRDARPFRAYRDRRNATSHAYDEAKANAVLVGLDGFLDDIRYLLGRLGQPERSG
jgi:nucleotidyltransferase substrate binding protein (TIGR01987 family)